MKFTTLIAVGCVGVFIQITTVKGQAISFVPGYIINLKGDTVKGDIKMNSKNEMEPYAKVSMKVKGAMTTYQAAKIKEYSVNGEMFVARKVDGDVVLLKRLSSGKVNLYQHKSEVFVMNNTKIVIDYYAEKPGTAEPIRLKSGRTFKKQVAELMSDNATILKDLEDKKYEYETVTNLFDAYNSEGNEPQNN